MIAVLALVGLLLLYATSRPTDKAEHLADLLIISAKPEGDLRDRRFYPGKETLLLTVANHDRATVERAYEIAVQHFSGNALNLLPLEDAGMALYEIQYDVPFYWVSRKGNRIVPGQTSPILRLGIWPTYLREIERDVPLRNLEPFKAQVLTQEQQEQAVSLFLRTDWRERLRVKIHRKLKALF